MKEKIKVIDLLNKMANNEEVPKKIKWKGNIYEYDGETQNYIRLINCTYDWLLEEDITAMLNDEIEIIEEKPKKIEQIYHCCMESKNPEIQVIVDNINFMSDKINELQKAVNYLLEKGNEE